MWKLLIILLVLIPGTLTIAGAYLYHHRSRLPWVREKRLRELEAENRRLDELIEKEVSKKEVRRWR